MLQASTVSIVHEDAIQGGRELADELLDALGRRPDLVLLFVSAKYDPHQVVTEMVAKLGPNVLIAGCSTFAEINEDGGTTESMTAMGLNLGKDLQAHVVSAHAPDADARELGRLLGKEAHPFHPNLLIAFPDGLAYSKTELLQGIHDELGRSIPIVGGGAGDFTFTKTYQIHNSKVITGGIVAVVLSGPVQMVTAARSGWTPVGATHRVTGVENGNLLLEIDGHPALELYEKYLGDRAAQMPNISIEYPLGIVGGTPGSEKKLPGEVAVLRAVIGVDRARKALVMGGDMPMGAEVRMTTATKDEVIRGAEEATQRAVSALPDASCALLFDCMARKLVLGPRYRAEIAKSFELLGSIPKMGMYSFGELSPVDGTTMSHDETFTIALLKG